MPRLPPQLYAANPLSYATGNLGPGKATRVTTREPGDLPSAVVTREDVGRGVQTLASPDQRKPDGETWFAVTCH